MQKLPLPSKIPGYAHVFYKKGALEIFAILTVKHLCQDLFLIKLQVKNTFFTEHLRATASRIKKIELKRSYTTFEKRNLTLCNLDRRFNDASSRPINAKNSGVIYSYLHVVCLVVGDTISRGIDLIDRLNRLIDKN